MSLFIQKSLTITLVLGLSVTSSFVQAMPMTEGSGMGAMKKMSMPAMQGGTAPKNARDPHAHSGGYKYRGISGWETTDMLSLRKVMVEQLEYRNNNNGNNVLRWDMQGWQGTDYRKLWVKFEGEDETSTGAGDLELQVLYSRTVAAFWDVQVGARYDKAYGSRQTTDRLFSVVGFQGLAPYWFEAEPTLYVSNKGDVSARLVSSYDLLFSQRLILQPRFEVNLSASDARDFGLGKGVNDTQLGLRLRYEINRKLTPYFGVSWQKKYGTTANLARADGETTNNTSLLAGIRFWF